MIRSISAEPRFRDSRPWAASACQGATHHLGDRLRGPLFQMPAPERQTGAACRYEGKAQPAMSIPGTSVDRRAGRRRRVKRSPLLLPSPLAPGQTVLSPISVGTQRFDRIIVCTPWLTPGSDLAELLRSTVSSWLEPDDLVTISEKAVVVATGRVVPADEIRVGRLAKSSQSMCVRPGTRAG